MKTVSKNFESEVLLKYQVYNSLFLTLPIDQVSSTGHLLPLLTEHCLSALKQGKDPVTIIDSFLDSQVHLNTADERFDFLFRVIQYVERQVVLLDALEDAAYVQINDTHDNNTYNHFYEFIQGQARTEELEEFLKDYAVRLVLTAHPTQFYPGYVLGIITDLVEAIKENDIEAIRTILIQLGKTPFFRKEKPSPLDEAINLSWFLENIFYHAAGDLYKRVKELNADPEEELNTDLFQLGFWPGGDRDGNPFVNVETTYQVARRLREILMRRYHKDIRQLRRRLSFRGIYEKINKLEGRFSQSLQSGMSDDLRVEDFIQVLDDIARQLEEEHGGLFLEELNDLRDKVKLFGFHFASIDIRQDSRKIKHAFDSLIEQDAGLKKKLKSEISDEKKASELFKTTLPQLSGDNLDETDHDTFESFSVIRRIQKFNGERGAHRYIISHCQGIMDIAHVFALARFSGWKGELSLDIVPLFETINDLLHAHETMDKLFSHPVYREHISQREDHQTVMLGFSDGTKDGGYLSANWNIYKAKERITAAARQHGVNIIFFDGRGGPPARGGGNTQKFYSSLGKMVENHEIHLTIQGQTISSHFGTVNSAIHNLETLMVAGLENQLLEDNTRKLSDSQRSLLEELSMISQKKYEDLKKSPDFMPYLIKLSPLTYYGKTNIASRPSKRGDDSEMKFEDLRAIPFVGSWSQIKQNVPGYYGMGTALKFMQGKGRLHECRDLYQRSAFFKALIENSMQSLSKCDFSFTSYLEKDKQFGKFWGDLHSEFLLSKELLLEVSGQKRLLDTNPTSQKSIALRQDMVVPLITIQQYALEHIRHDCPDKEIMEKLVVRSMFGNINASRNSA